MRINVPWKSFCLCNWYYGSDAELIDTIPIVYLLPFDLMKKGLYFKLDDKIIQYFIMETHLRIKIAVTD